MSAADAAAQARRAMAAALYALGQRDKLNLSTLQCHELAGLALRKSGFPELAATYEAASALVEISAASAATHDPDWPTPEATTAMAAYVTAAEASGEVEFLAPLRTDTIEV